MRVRFSLKLLFCVRAGKNADVITHTGVLTGLQIEHCVADVCNLIDSGYSGHFHGAEYQIWSRSSPRDIIATDHGTDQISVPLPRIQEKFCYRPIKSGVEGNPNSPLLQPGKDFG